MLKTSKKKKKRKSLSVLNNLITTETGTKVESFLSNSVYTKVLISVPYGMKINHKRSKEKKRERKRESDISEGRGNGGKSKTV